MASSPLVLGLDNSLDFLNLVLGDNEGLIEERHIKTGRHSSEIVGVKISQFLYDHKYATKDLSGLIVTIGPGSFTGVRVAITFAKGLSSSLSIPLTGIPTPLALATPFRFMEGFSLCPLIDAKKSEVFFALYRVSAGLITPIAEPIALKPEELRGRLPARTFCFGNGVKACEDILATMEGVQYVSEGFHRVTGEALLLSAPGNHRSHLSHHHELRPLYGRRSEAEIKFHLTLE